MAAKHVVWPTPVQLLERRGGHVGRRARCPRVDRTSRHLCPRLAPAAFATLSVSISRPRLLSCAAPTANRPIAGAALLTRSFRRDVGLDTARRLQPRRIYSTKFVGKSRLSACVPVVLIPSVAGLLLFLLLLGSQGPAPVTMGALAIGLCGLASLPWAHWHDRRARLVRLYYVFDSLGDKVQEGLARLLAAFERTNAIWAVHHEHVHGDWKRNAGAGTSVGRRRVNVGWGAPFALSRLIRESDSSM